MHGSLGSQMRVFPKSCPPDLFVLASLQYAWEADQHTVAECRQGQAGSPKTHRKRLEEQASKYYRGLINYLYYFGGS